MGEQTSAAAFTLRPATAADDATIKRMVRREGLDPTAIKWSRFLVAEADGEIVGIGQVREHGDCRELGSLTVLPAYRGRGIAAALVTALEARAGLPLYLFCLDRTRTYYERFGFTQISYGQMPRSLKLKSLIPLAFRLFGMRVIVMRKG